MQRPVNGPLPPEETPQMPATFIPRGLVLALLMGAPLPLAADSAAGDAELIERGRVLFNDALFSRAGTHNCASCHPAELGLEGHTTNNTYVGMDIVADGTAGGRSTPTLWGAQHRTLWGWAGLPTIEQNIRGIIVNRMQGPEPTEQEMAALVAYIMSLPLPETPYVDETGTPLAMAPEEVHRGHDIFWDSGCASCHMPPSFESTGTHDVAGLEVKVPSLWAVRHTGPWFHDGRYATLEEAVRAMWRFQGDLIGDPTPPTDQEIADLVAYLEAL